MPKPIVPINATATKDKLQQYQREMQECLTAKFFQGSKTSDFLNKFLDDTALTTNEKFTFLVKSSTIFNLGCILAKNNYYTTLDRLLSFMLIVNINKQNLEPFLHTNFYGANLGMFIKNKNTLTIYLRALSTIAGKSEENKKLVYNILKAQDLTSNYTLHETIAITDTMAVYLQLLEKFQGPTWANKILELMNMRGSVGQNFANSIIESAIDEIAILSFINLLNKLIINGGNKDAIYKLILNTRYSNFIRTLPFLRHSFTFNIIDLLYNCEKVSTENNEFIDNFANYKYSIIDSITERLHNPLGQKYFIEAKKPGSFLNKILSYGLKSQEELKNCVEWRKLMEKYERLPLKVKDEIVKLESLQSYQEEQKIRAQAEKDEKQAIAASLEEQTQYHPRLPTDAYPQQAPSDQYVDFHAAIYPYPPLGALPNPYYYPQPPLAPYPMYAHPPITPVTAPAFDTALVNSLNTHYLQLGAQQSQDLGTEVKCLQPSAPALAITESEQPLTIHEISTIQVASKTAAPTPKDIPLADDNPFALNTTQPIIVEPGHDLIDFSETSATNEVAAIPAIDAMEILQQQLKALPVINTPLELDSQISARVSNNGLFGKSAQKPTKVATPVETPTLGL